MLFIWFIYGLAFFILGLTIFVYPKKQSAFKLARDLWLIAGFGILHGINEWLDMFIAFGEPFPPHILKLVRMVILVLSFLCLVRFGTKVISETRKKFRYIQILPIPLFIIWLAVFLISKDRLLVGDIAARYLLSAPGSFLTAIALLLYIPQFKATKLTAVTRSLYISAFTFFLYGILAGLIVKKASFFGANFLNYDLFLNTFGIPVQIFRAICAIVLACTATHVLSIFRWETRETLRKSELRFSMIASATPIILFVQDRTGIITFIQGNGLQSLGLKPDNIIGRSIAEAFPSATQLIKDCFRALSGQDFASTISINGAVFEACYSPLRDHDGEVTGMIGVALDVTAKVNAEDELNQYRTQMRKSARLAEIGTLGSAMAAQIDEPLAVARLLLQRLATDIATDSPTQNLDQTLKKALDEVSKTAEIVQRFCSTAQVTGETTAQPVDLYQITKTIMGVFAKTAKHANLRIIVRDMDVVPYMTIPPRQLEQVFFTLVQNAIDAADPATNPELVISAHPSENQIELKFSDTCGGINSEKLQKIFDPFIADSPTQTGLGLAIAKRIISTNGGEITAQSQPGQGTTFIIKLPVQKLY